MSSVFLPHPMNKLALLLALVAGFSALPSARAKDAPAPPRAPSRTTKGVDELPAVTAAKQAVADAEKALMDAKKSGKKDAIQAAQAKLEEARKALREARKAAKPVKPDAPATK